MQSTFDLDLDRINHCFLEDENNEMFTFNSDENWICNTGESTQYSDTFSNLIEEETINTSNFLISELKIEEKQLTNTTNNIKV